MTAETDLNQRTITKTTRIDEWAEAFLIDRKVRGLSAGTLYFYQAKMKLFLDYCDSQLLTEVEQLTPMILRRYLIYLEERGHNAGGQHACYRTIKTFLIWWEDEIEPEGWKNPIQKVKAPRLRIGPLAPVELDTVEAMIRVCDKSFTGVRDIAAFLFLLDTGLRATELVSLDLNDLDFTSAFVRDGKGHKSRTVLFCQKSRRAIRKYLRARNDDCNALWVTKTGTRLTYSGLRQIVRRRAEKASVQTPQIHAFRRAFALNSLRAGMDVYSLQRLMGHSDLQVLRRYLDQSIEDLQKAHRQASPVDSMRF